MSDPQIFIEVLFEGDPSEGTLHVDPQGAHASPGAEVFWRFQGLPEGYQPLIHFESGEPGNADYGPFPALCLAPGAITGVVGEEAGGEWPYQIFLYPLPGFGVETLAPALDDVLIMIPDDPRDGQDPGT